MTNNFDLCFLVNLLNMKFVIGYCREKVPDSPIKL